MDFYIGTILPWAVSYAPEGWLICDGASLPVAQYQALFCLIGTTYGGNITNFNIPDLRGRFPVGVNNGGIPNCSTYRLGQTGGAETGNANVNSSGLVMLNANNLPVHTHTFTGDATDVDISVTGNVDFSKGSSSVPATKDSSTANATSIPGQTDGLVLGPAKNSTSPSSNCNMYRSKSGTATNNINVLTNPLSGTETITSTGKVNIKPKGTIGSSPDTVLPVNIQTWGISNFDTRSPYLAINFIICVMGYYPVHP